MPERDSGRAETISEMAARLGVPLTCKQLLAEEDARLVETLIRLDRRR